MNIEQLMNNKIFCATTRIYAFLAEASQVGLGNKTVYVTIKEIMETLDLSENTVRSAINKLINNNLIEMSGKKRAFIINATKESKKVMKELWNESKDDPEMISAMIADANKKVYSIKENKSKNVI